MSLFAFLILLVIAGICGSVGQALAGRSSSGCMVSIALGFIGALLGRWIQQEFGLPVILAVDLDGEKFPIVWAIAGAALFTALLMALGGGRRAPAP